MTCGWSLLRGRRGLPGHIHSEPAGTGPSSSLPCPGHTVGGVAVRISVPPSLPLSGRSGICPAALVGRAVRRPAVPHNLNSGSTSWRGVAPPAPTFPAAGLIPGGGDFCMREVAAWV